MKGKCRKIIVFGRRFRSRERSDVMEEKRNGGEGKILSTKVQIITWNVRG